MPWTTEQNERVLAEIRRRAEHDPAFRKLCLTDAAAAIREVAGEELPRGLTVSFVENERGNLTVVLPGLRDLELSDSALDRVVGGVTGTCFAAGTPVLVAGGGSRPIETLGRGDQVLALDASTGTIGPRTITGLLQHAPQTLYRSLIEGTTAEIYLTPNHPFYSQSTWVQIGKLPLGAELYHYDAKSHAQSRPRLLGLQSTVRTEPVYNLEVDLDHNYFVNGLLVHNGSPIGGIGKVK